jgi:hypothetical protein
MDNTGNTTCSSRQIFTITEPPPLSVVLTSTDASCPAASDGTASAVASGGISPYNYSWSTSPVQTSGSATGLPPGTYTVNVSDANGCTATGTINVGATSLQAPIVVNNALGGNLCASTNITYTITNYNASYTYSVTTTPVTAVSNPSAGTYIVNWTSSSATVIIDITVNNGSSCSETTSVIVYGCCPASTTGGDIVMDGTSGQDDLNDLLAVVNPLNTVGGTLYHIGPVWTYNNPTGTLYLNGTFGITSSVATNVTFSAGSKIRMGGGAKIVITGSGPCTVNFTETHIAAGCNDMWDGLYFSGLNKAVNISGSASRCSLFEDAINGIVSSNGGSFYTNNAIFNKNRISIQALNYPNAHPGNIRNTVFTCRDIPFGTNMASLKGTSLPQCQLPQLPVNIYTRTFLLFPHSGERSYAGVYVNRIGSTVVNPVTQQVISASNIVIGTGNVFATLNVFDNMDFGVYAVKSNVNVINNQFQNLTGPGTLIKYPDKEYGIGVYAETDAGSSTNQILVGGGALTRNSFYDCNRGVDINGYYDITVTENCFQSTINYSATLTSGYVSQVGNNAIFIKSGRYADADVGNNHIFNWVVGIAFYSEFVLSNSQYIRLQGNALIHDNEIAPVSSGTITNEFIGTAIIAESLTLTCSCTPQTTYLGNLDIRDNAVTDAFNGIQVKGWSIPWVVYNMVILRYRPNNGATVFKQYAIRGISNVEPVIYLNHLSGNTATGNTTGKVGLRGIYMTGNLYPYVRCNDMTYVGQCMVFEGDNEGTVWDNVMNDATDGLVLINGGRIGPQWAPSVGTTPGTSNDNLWNGPFTGSHTVVDASSFASNSILYVRQSGLPYEPTNHAGPSLNAYANGFTVVLITAGPTRTCPPVYMPPAPGSVSELRQLLEDIVLDSVQYPVFPAESSWQGKQQVYAMIQLDSTLLNGSPVLQQFYNTTATAGIGQINAIDQALAQTNLSTASAINQALVSQNLIEQNYQDVNTIFISMLNGNSPDSIQIQTLEVIAAQCPQQGGKAVYRARTLLCVINDHVYEWNDDCPSSSLRTMSEQSLPPTSPTSDVQLYPNPNDGNMTLSYVLPENQQGFFIVYDIMGNEVMRMDLQSGNQQQVISLQTLASGMYYYQVVFAAQIIRSDKIVINR